jgi:hypothetical protein
MANHQAQPRENDKAQAPESAEAPAEGSSLADLTPEERLQIAAALLQC